jgi:hypothetical protein
MNFSYCHNKKARLGGKNNPVFEGFRANRLNYLLLGHDIKGYPIYNTHHY